MELLARSHRQADDLAGNGRHGAAVIQVLLGGLQLFLGFFQILLGGKDLRFAVLAVDPHQNLTGRYGEIVHQITGDHRAADGGVQISHPVILQFSGFVGIHGIAVHNRSGSSHHILGQHTLVGDHDLGGKQLRTLRRDAADHVDCLHGALHGGHQRRDGDLHLLPRLQLPGVGVAVILLQTHPGIVREDGDLGALANLVAGVQCHNIHQFSGVGRRKIQPRNVLLQRIDLLLIALNLIAGLLDLRGSIGGINGKQGVPLLHFLSLLHEYIHHRARSGQADGFAGLGLYQTAAVHLGADGTVGHHGGAHLAAAALLFEEFHAACDQGGHDHQRNDPPDRTPPLFLVCRAFFRLFRRGLR